MCSTEWLIKLPSNDFIGYWECKYVEIKTGFCDINLTRPNIQVENIWVFALSNWQCLSTYVFVGCVYILSPTVEKSIVYPLSNGQEINSCRLYVCPLSKGR